MIRPEGRWHRRLFGVAALTAALLGLFLLSQGGGLDRRRLIPSSGSPTAEAGKPAEKRNEPGTRISARSAHESPADLRASALEVLVYSESSGEGLPHAALQVLDGEELVLQATTDESGLATLDEFAVPYDAIVAAATGYVARSAPIDEAPTSRISIGLPAAGELSGIVVLPDGSGAGAGVHVLAWEEADYPSSSLTSRWRRGDLRAVAAETEEASRFVLPGMHPDRVYFAVAAGRGYVSPRYSVGVRVGMSDLRIEVERAYATQLAIREEGGRGLRTPAVMYGRRFGGPRIGRRDASLIYGVLPQVALLVNPLPRLEDPLADRFYIFTAPSDEALLGPIQLGLDFPGYEPFSTSFWVPALDDESSLPRTQVELKPATEDWGHLALQFHWRLAGWMQVREVEPLGFLRLRDDSGKLQEYAVRDSFPSMVEIGAIPGGEYEWEFETLSGEFRLPFMEDPGANLLSLGPRTELDLDLSSLGAVRLEILHLDGSPFRGAAWVRCEREGGPEVPARIFKGPPYVSSGLVTGVYEIWVDEPRFLDRSEATARASTVTVVVEPEHVTDAVLYLPE